MRIQTKIRLGKAALDAKLLFPKEKKVIFTAKQLIDLQLKYNERPN